LVNVREPVESRTAKEKNPTVRLLYSNLKVTAGELIEKKEQREISPFFRGRVYVAREPSQASPLRFDR
jgi:hypothetical protein